MQALHSFGISWITCFMLSLGVAVAEPGSRVNRDAESPPSEDTWLGYVIYKTPSRTAKGEAERISHVKLDVKGFGATVTLVTASGYEVPIRVGSEERAKQLQMKLQGKQTIDVSECLENKVDYSKSSEEHLHWQTDFACGLWDSVVLVIEDISMLPLYDMRSYKHHPFTFTERIRPDRARRHCFTGETPVDTPSGPKEISQLKAGDEVYSYDEKSRQVVVSKVLKTHVTENQAYWSVGFSNGAVINATPEHPFYSADHCRYMPLSEMNVDETMILRTEEGQACLSEIQKHNRKGTVHNITVDTFENYFVRGILVHNKGME